MQAQAELERKKKRLDALQTFEYELIRDLRVLDVQVQELTDMKLSPLRERVKKYADKIAEGMQDE